MCVTNWYMPYVLNGNISFYISFLISCLYETMKMYFCNQSIRSMKNLLPTVYCLIIAEKISNVNQIITWIEFVINEA